MSVSEWRSAPPCTRDPVTKSARMEPGSGPVAEVEERAHRLAPRARAEEDRAVERRQAEPAQGEALERRGAAQRVGDDKPGKGGRERGGADAPAERAPVLQLAERNRGERRDAPQVDVAVQVDRDDAAQGGAGQAEMEGAHPAERDRERERDRVDAEREAS